MELARLSVGVGVGLGNGGTGGGGDSAADQCPDDDAARVVERARFPGTSTVDPIVLGLRRLPEAEGGPMGEGPEEEAVKGEWGVLSS